MIEFPLEYLVHYFMEHRADHLSASLACRHTLCIITHILFEHEATLDVHYAHFAGRALRFFDVRLLPYSCTLAWALARDPQTSAVLGGNGVVETLVDWLALCMLRFVDVAGVREPLADCLRSRTLLLHSMPRWAWLSTGAEARVEGRTLTAGLLFRLQPIHQSHASLRHRAEGFL